ncbi:MAG: hypothetical protein KC635_16365 [Myxococcales bacterium]|nr:hypothetical protein [Myxococcales bacterium]MCB9732879.1 hypothetical protein [Deltaproteobacteria bacterium]
MTRTLQFVLEQGIQGHHALIPEDVIRRAFRGPSCLDGGLDAGVAAETDALIDALQKLNDLRSQQACVADAPRDVQDVFVHLYFSFLDRMIVQRGATYH